MTLSTMLSTMSEGMLRTCGIFVLTLIGSLPLGMVVALLRRSKYSVVRGITRAYIAVIRGTPLMLQLLVWYFGPYYLFGWSIRGWRFPALTASSSTIRLISRRSTAAGSSLSRPGSMRRPRCWVTRRPRPFSTSFCRR